MGRRKPRDHRGREFETVRGMCRAYGVSVSAYYDALEQGATIREALEPEKRKYYRYRRRIFLHKEGLMAYAGVTRWADIADEVETLRQSDLKKDKTFFFIA